MPKEIPLIRRLNTKLGGITLALLGLTLAFVVTNLFILEGIKADAIHNELLGRARKQTSEYLYLTHRLVEVSGEERDELVGQIRQVVELVEARFETLSKGDAAEGVPPVTDRELANAIRERHENWKTRFTPALARLLSAPTREDGEPILEALRKASDDRLSKLDEDMETASLVTRRKVTRFEYLQLFFTGLVVIVFGLVYAITRGVAKRTGVLASTAERIAQGELELAAPVSGNDEIAALGETFNHMTTNLRRLVETEKEGREAIERLLGAVAETTNALASGTSEILAGTTQQASGAQEQATAISETVTTVDEVTRTAEQAAQRARAVAEASQRSLEISKSGRKSVEDAVIRMDTVKEQVEGIAESILALAEQAQAIGEIIATVKDIAEQTNILALNAGIEASRAGDQGKGFAVVAAEVKALADQARSATVQVRQILGDIQKATNSAVMLTEEGNKSVNSATKVVAQAGETIKSLSDTIAEAAQSAVQISASAGQQAAGMAQIHQAMKQVSQATSQNLASTKQQERAAEDLNSLGIKLKELMSGFGA